MMKNNNKKSQKSLKVFTEKWTIVPMIWDWQHLQQPPYSLGFRAHNARSESGIRYSFFHCSPLGRPLCLLPLLPYV